MGRKKIEVSVSADVNNNKSLSLVKMGGMSFGGKVEKSEKIPELANYNDQISWCRKMAHEDKMISVIYESFQNWTIPEIQKVMYRKDVIDTTDKTNETIMEEAVNVMNWYFYDSGIFNLKEFLRQTFFEYLTSGKVCETHIWHKVKYQKKEYELPYSITIQDPSRVSSINSSLIGLSFPVLTIRSDDQVAKIVKEKKPKEIFDKIPKYIIDAYTSNKPILFPSENISVLYKDKQDYENEPVPFIYRAYQSRKKIEKLEEMDYSMIDSIINIILLATVGENPNANKKIVASDIENLKSLLKDPTRSFALVVPNYVDLKYVSPDIKELLSNDKLTAPIKELYSSLGVGVNFIRGEGSDAKALTISVRNLSSNFSSWRDSILTWFRSNVLKRIMIKNDWLKEDENNGDVTIPYIWMPRVRLNDENVDKEVLKTLYDRGLISNQTMLNENSMDPGAEKFMLDQEKTTFQVEPRANPNTTPGNTIIDKNKTNIDENKVGPNEKKKIKKGMLRKLFE